MSRFRISPGPHRLVVLCISCNLFLVFLCVCDGRYRHNLRSRGATIRWSSAQSRAANELSMLERQCYRLVRLGAASLGGTVRVVAVAGSDADSVRLLG